MKIKLEQLKKEAIGKLDDFLALVEKTPQEAQEKFRELEQQFLGRKGKLAILLKDLKDLGEDVRKESGEFANNIKKDLEGRFGEVFAKIKIAEPTDASIDVTLPGTKKELGSLHPVTIIQKEIEDLFSSIGFMILDGPELESDYFNFEALNVAPHHPARDMQDTFYLDKKNENGEYDLLMRTQTSPMQVRAMKKYGAPLRAIIPGRCFRSEATDSRHEHTFYQLEGIMIDKKINFSHMKGIMDLVGKRLYGEDTGLKMRPKFYPFVEPGSNGEYTCFLCGGKGCRVCKNTGWLEIVGCGLIHPEVLLAGGIDPEEYSGFAFGFGLNRLVMLKYGIDDIRLFNGGDIRFLEQF
ncbi:MAG: phenylalanine--tRNA ligase subunit alpha [Candidatus Falkowbacteria bacterium]|nr:phenylalanine--tRNA ligase subunit alpha [Candidatus Falkowbacteria bacterium]